MGKESISFIQSYANKDFDVMKRATIPISLPIEEVKKIDDMRAKLGYRSRNEVIRESIRRFIEEVGEMKIIKLRDVPREKAKREILDYLRKKEIAYPSDISDELRLDYGLVADIIRELWEEKKVEDVK